MGAKFGKERAGGSKKGKVARKQPWRSDGKGTSY